jgi:hypothetical protein
MRRELSSDREQILSEAVNHLKAAIQILDGVGVSAHIGAHVDLALRQLNEIVKPEPQISNIARRLAE